MLYVQEREYLTCEKYEEKQAEEISFRFNFEERKGCVHSFMGGRLYLAPMKVYLLLMTLPLMTISHCVPEAMNAIVLGSHVWKSSQKLQLGFQLQQSPLSALVLELESEKANAVEPTHSSWWY